MFNQYTFTDDWVTSKKDIWIQVIPRLKEKKQFLEIGSHEGNSAIWFVENALEDGGEITCIDSWVWNIKHESTFDSNIALCLKNNCNKKINKIKGYSYYQLACLVSNKKLFDLIYIDGSHIAQDVLTNACFAWGLLKIDGIIIFDDYLLKVDDTNQYAKIAIDLFTNIFNKQIEYLYIGNQLIIKKAR